MLHILEANPEMEEMSYNEGMKMLKNTPVEQWKMPLKLKVCDLMCEDKLDGIEAYNGNCNWVQEPEKVKEILERMHQSTFRFQHLIFMDRNIWRVVE